MPDQQSRSLKIIASVQAIIGGLIAVVVFALYGLGSPLLTNPGASLTSAILGTIGVVYFLSIHLLLSKKHLGFSTLILTLITALNFLLVIAFTGGLDSPYYSLWILAIVVAGIFGTTQTIIILSLTIAYYLFELIAEGLHAPFIRDHLVQLAITIIAAGVAEWVHRRSRKASSTSSRLEKLSGQLSAEQLKAEAIMGSIGEGVMVIDSTGKIQLFNKAAAELTGWDEASAQNIDYQPVLQLKTADDQPLNQFTDPFTEAWNKGSSVVRDNLVMTTRSGRRIQLNLSVSPIYDDHRQPSGAIALFRDISQEKEVERQKDEFVSTASHEMRTPVAAIEGYISLAMNANVATIDDRAKKYLEKAHETIAHLGELFRDLLSVTKADEGGLSGKVEAINLAKLLQDVTDDMQFTTQKKNLTLVYQIGELSGKTIAPLYYVAANPERLREVVMNLIDNAIKFTSEGGVKVTLDGNDKEVTVSVADTGIGIASEDIPHLFQKFYRIDNSATRTIGGTGLGLYLCRRLIELFNGRIWVESKQGQGTTFRFSLPRLSQTEIAQLEANGATTPTPANPTSHSAPTAAEPAPQSSAPVTPAPTPPPPPQPITPPPQPIAVPIPGEPIIAAAGPALSPSTPTTTTPQARPISSKSQRRVQ